jgi:predicted secreted protein
MRRIRVLALVGVFILALCGCQKGNRQASNGSPDMAEAMKADSKGGKAEMKSGSKVATKAGKTGGAHQASKTSSGKEGSHAAAVPRGALTMNDNEMEYDFKVGQTVTVVLDSNKASGLSWTLVEPMGSVIVPQGLGSYAVKAGKSGDGSETWHFRCAKPGYQTVKMEYRRKWAQSMPERTFRFSGNVR